MRFDVKLKKSRAIFCNYQKKIEKLFQERIRFQNLYKYEIDFHNNDMKYIAGIDEAGRGSLAGPVVAAAVILPEYFFVPDVKDSKKLTPKKREEIYPKILNRALDVGIGIVSAEVIDNINIAQATFLAMKRAIHQLKYIPEGVLVDGFKIKNISIPQIALTKGEDKSISIAAASIIAKVYRDNLMIQLDRKFPQFQFKKNKGYGTKDHFLALRKFKATSYHRKSFAGVIVQNGLQK